MNRHNNKTFRAIDRKREVAKIDVVDPMSTFEGANQARLALKMKLCFFAWYKSSLVVSHGDGFHVVVNVENINSFVKRTIPPVVNGVSVYVEDV